MAAVAQASPRHVSDVSPPPSAREDQRPQRGCRRVAAADQHHRHARLNRGRQEGGAVSRKHVGQPVKEEVARRRVGGRSGGGGGGRGGPGGGRCAQLSLAERRRAAPAEKVAAAVRARRVDDSGEALDQRLFACVTMDMSGVAGRVLDMSPSISVSSPWTSSSAEKAVAARASEPAALRARGQRWGLGWRGVGEAGVETRP